MRWTLRITDERYRELIGDPKLAGWLPSAWLTWGYVTGLGWGFLRPWAQQALFPAKGSPAGVGHPDRHHEPFWILRLRTEEMTRRHRNQDFDVTGLYWHALVWRRSWGKRWGIWRWREVILDPDEIRPGVADDWGERPGEGW